MPRDYQEALERSCKLLARSCKIHGQSHITDRVTNFRRFASLLSHSALWLANFYCVPIRIVKAEDPLSPRLLFYGVDQLDMWRDIVKRGIKIAVFEIQKQVSSPIGSGSVVLLVPDRL